MLRSLWLVGVYLTFLGLGVVTPFVLTLGYVWVDTFQPQTVAYVILNELPVAMIMGVAAFASYLMVDRRSPPPLTALTFIQILMAAWMTVTLIWAVAPERAIIKWDWAFKTAAFAAFIPFVIRSRVQIEAFASTYVFSLAGNFVPFGLKVLISGGGYGQNLGLQGGNAGLSEGGYLSTVCLMAVPLTLYLGKHGQLIPRLPKISLAYLGVATLAIITALGTYERSALVGLAILLVYMFIRSRNKLLFGTLVVVFGGIGLGLTASSWLARMQTSSDYLNENSALVRLLVWKWTLDFSTTHPFGGGFDSYVTNTIIIPGNAANPMGYIEFGRAFHSIYFEVLGELGYPGIVMFIGAGLISTFSLFRLSSKCRKILDLVWVADMADAVVTGTLVFLASGAFVGIAFQPPFWYFIAMSVCLQAFVYRYERIQGFTAGTWAQAAAKPLPEPAAPAQGWRRPGVTVARRDLARR
jgi:probable O-glycosylation ligase (exosortase A-associated)